MDIRLEVEKKVKKIIDMVKAEFVKNPLMFFNETDIVCRLVEELKKEFPEKIKLSSEAVNAKKGKAACPCDASRVHTELDILKGGSSRASKIDIGILRKTIDKEIVLKGKDGKWSSGTPSSEVNLDDIAYGIEVKFFRNIQEDFTPNEINGLDRTKEKLEKLKGNSILLIFSHGPVSKKVKKELDKRFNGRYRLISSGLYP